MDLRRTQPVSVVLRELVDRELVEAGLEVLEVGHVARGADDGACADGVQTLDGFEAGEGAVGCCGVVGR